MALLGLLDQTPDLIVSGVNLGANIGHDLTYSGTVAAAMEGVIGGVPAIAVSLDTYEGGHYDVAARFTAQLVERVLQTQLSDPLLLNVNVPALPAEDIRGVQITRLGHRLYRDALIKRSDPRGRTYYRIGGDPPGGIVEQGTDFGALSQGYIPHAPTSPICFPFLA
jgi:5'-nucleotidase